MIIDGIIQILSKYPEFGIIGYSTSGNHLINSLANLTDINVFIIDINLPDIDGMIVAQRCLAKFPDCKIIILSMLNNRSIIKNAFNKGIKGYVLKNSGENELVDAIHSVIDNKNFISKDAMTSLIEGINQTDELINNNILSDREISIAKLVSKGFTANEIADILFISPRTVETHKRNTMHKLGFKNTSELIKYAIQIGWLE